MMAGQPDAMGDGSMGSDHKKVIFHDHKKVIFITSPDFLQSYIAQPVKNVLKKSTVGSSERASRVIRYGVGKKRN